MDIEGVGRRVWLWGMKEEMERGGRLLRVERERGGGKEGERWEPVTEESEVLREGGGTLYDLEETRVGEEGGEGEK